MNKKGFTYIIISVMIMIFITVLFVYSTNINYQENIAPKILNNYKNEINIFIKEDLNIEKLDLFNDSFIKYALSNNYNVKLCNVIFDGNNTFIVSNYLNQDFKDVNDKETKSFNLEEVSENIEFGGCLIDINNLETLKFYIVTSSENERIVYSQ